MREDINIIGFLCNWCSYAGADFTGLSRIVYPANIKIIRMPCTGRMDPMLIIEAFHKGADGVLVSGCHPGDCHYTEGNYYWRRRYASLKSLLEFFGIDKRRFHASWVSASEGKKFAEVVKKVVADVGDWKENGQVNRTQIFADYQDKKIFKSCNSAFICVQKGNSYTIKLQETARNLLAENKVDVIIGYEKGYDDLHGRPVFISNPEDVDKLIINKYCTNNLAVYLPIHRKIRIGIVAKDCSIKSIRELIKEHQIPKENVVVIDVICEEMEDTKAVEEFEKLPVKEKGEFWDREFEKCLRCYACRQACPVCYCPDCFAQRNMPEYLNPKVATNENKLFQMIRMQHVFGRCTDCKACENACPVGIPLSLITMKMAKDAFELFGYVSGMDEETRPPLSSFLKDEVLEEIM